MHLLPAFVTTTSTRKRKPSNNKRAAQSRADHEAWVLSMTKGMKSDKKVLDKLRKEEYTKSMVVDRSAFAKTGMASGVCGKPEPKVYSGERKLLGIATMHKSNMVPVFAKQDAEDIARMRRG
jgi:hypothetical protein